MIKKNKINDESGGQLGEYPNDKYRQFFEKFSEINTLDVANYKPVHLLAYFCKKYEEQYQVKYNFKFNSPSPSKCFEVFQIKRMGILLSSNPKILKEYIDWVFINKVAEAKRRLTSISFMTNDIVITEYKLKVLFANGSNDITRSTLLPNNFKEILSKHHINTYGDLSFAYQMSPPPENIRIALNEIEVLGFDKNILDKII